MIMVSVMSVRPRTSRTLMLTAFMSSNAAWTRPGTGDEGVAGRDTVARRERVRVVAIGKGWSLLTKFSVRAEHNTRVPGLSCAPGPEPDTADHAPLRSAGAVP